ncbi:MAG: 2Fe-2S iron-sulfur cluster binding domain-containing protein [Clostridia bacterium]|nr:2Fe-2S iron-sulfur cluster binding domain-containing protein [Clostridia bacterium]
MSLNDLKRTDIASMLAKRVKAVASSSGEVKDLYSYYPNKLAAELHPAYQELVVEEIKEHSPDMKSYVLAPNKKRGAKKLAWFSAGQYLSIRLSINGAKLCRPYSIASSPADTLKNRYMITVKRVWGGIASEYILDNWTVGTSVTSSAPLGEFTYEPLRDAATVIGIAGGSGITPFRSLAYAIAEGDEDCELILLYGSRTLSDAVFSDEIAEIAKTCPRVKLVNVLSDEKKKGCENGFITAKLIKKYAPKEGDYSVFLCGPQAMYRFVDKEIETLGIRRKFVRHELFGEYFDPAKNEDYPKRVKKSCKVTVRINGEEQTITCPSDTSLLRAMEAAGIKAPSDCRSGRCGWCRSQLVSGKVYVPAEVDGRRLADKDFGYIHPCCSFPLTDVVIDVPKAK